MKNSNPQYAFNKTELQLLRELVGMLEFLETHKRPEGQPLPSWSEFFSKANDYAVIL